MWFYVVKRWHWRNITGQVTAFKYHQPLIWKFFCTDSTRTFLWSFLSKCSFWFEIKTTKIMIKREWLYERKTSSCKKGKINSGKHHSSSRLSCLTTATNWVCSLQLYLKSTFKESWIKWDFKRYSMPVTCLYKLKKPSNFVFPSLRCKRSWVSCQHSAKNLKCNGKGAGKQGEERLSKARISD